MNIDISAVIPTLNREKTLKRVIEALLAQTYPKDKYEIIIVDDGSTDGTAKMVEDIIRNCKGGFQTRLAPTIIYIKQDPSKRGPAGANNLGIKTANGKYILFMNDDVIADKNLISEHMKSHESIVKAYCPPAGRAGNTPQQTPPRYIVQGRVINTSSLKDLGKKHEGYAGGYSDMSFGYFTTWNCSVEKALLVKAGLFDEDFRDLCWEDVEFGFRLRKLGVKQKYNKDAFGYHFRHVFNLDQIDGVKTKSVNMGKNAIMYYKKHPQIDVKISTESFWLPMAFQSMMKQIVRVVGKDRIIPYMKHLDKKKHHRLLSFLVGLAGKYWYLSGVKEAKLKKKKFK